MTYEVRVGRSGEWWAIEVPEHPGVFSQARRLDQVPEMAADALSLALDREVTPDEIELADVEVSSDLADLLDDLERLRKLADLTDAAARQTRIDAAALASERGLVIRDIGALLDVSPSYAARLVRRETAEPSGSPGKSDAQLRRIVERAVEAAVREARRQDSEPDVAQTA